MKKAISFFLAIAMAVMSMPVVFAVDSKEAVEGTVQFTSVGHGEFKLNNHASFFSNKASDSVNASTGDTIVAYPTEDEEIFETSDGKYLTHAYDDSYLLTNRIALDVDNLEQYKAIFESNDISDMYANIEDTVAEQKALGNKAFSVDVYVPDLLGNEGASVAGGTTTVSPEYTYRSSGGVAYRMKDYTAKYFNCTHRPVYWDGTQSKVSAKALVNIMISIAGIGATYISVFGVGVSLYDLYKNAHGEVINSSSSDSVEVSVVYDRLEKETKFFLTSAQNFVSGKTSHKVWLNYLHSDQYYKAKGTHHVDDTFVNRSHYSKYWDNNEQTIARIGKEAYLKVTYYNSTVILNGT